MFLRDRNSTLDHGFCHSLGNRDLESRSSHRVETLDGNGFLGHKNSCFYEIVSALTAKKRKEKEMATKSVFFLFFLAFGGPFRSFLSF